MKSDLANHTEMISSKKSKIGRDHLTVFRTILLFLKIFTLPVYTKEFLYRYKENGNTRSIVFAERVYHSNGIYSQEKIPNVWRLEKELQVERGIFWKKKPNNCMTYWVNFALFFGPIIQPYLSRMLFSQRSIWLRSTAVTCWPVGDRGDKRDSEG